MSWHSKPAKLLLKPQRRLSRTRSFARSWKYSAMCRPMKPAPPVTKTRIPDWCRAGHESSDRCVAKLEYRLGDPFSDPPKIVNPCENFLARGKAAFSRFYASKQESLFRPSLLTRDRSNAHVVWAKWTPSVATAAARCNKGYRHPLMRDQDALRENFGGPEHSTVA